jgi:hypothetical protein
VKKFFKKLWDDLFPEPQEKTVSPKTTPSDYYLLECWNQYADLPELILPYVDRIKRKVEWEDLGFVLEKNRLGQIRKIKIANRYFSFIPVNPSHAMEVEAIKNGKRLTQNPQHIQILVRQGCKPEEFLHFPAILNIATISSGVLIA